eukprot:2128913-Prymnesium_polylepis.1
MREPHRMGNAPRSNGATSGETPGHNIPAPAVSLGLLRAGMTAPTRPSTSLFVLIGAHNLSGERHFVRAQVGAWQRLGQRETALLQLLLRPEPSVEPPAGGHGVRARGS